MADASASSNHEDGEDIPFLETHKNQASRRRFHYLRRQITWNIAMTILLVSILSLQIFQSTHQGMELQQLDTTPEVILHNKAVRGVGCGKSAKEAEERGCIFDLMRIAWTPKECFHESISHNALMEGPFPWYRGLEGTDPLTPEQLKYEEKALTSWAYHISHCRYVLALAEFGLNRTDVLVPGDIASFIHTIHCGSFLGEKDVNASELGPVAIVRTSFCIRLGDYQ